MIELEVKFILFDFVHLFLLDYFCIKILLWTFGTHELIEINFIIVFKFFP